MKSAPPWLLLFVALPCWAGEFVDLDFESATVGPQPGAQVLDEAHAIPGWSAYLGDEKAPGILYNDITLGGASIVLREGSAPGGGASGNFALLLISGGNASGNQGISASIAQAGDVPTNVQTLLFDTSFSAGGTLTKELKVSLGGNVLPLQQVLPGTWGVTIADWSGKSAELRFEALFRGDQNFPQVFFALDNIRFSPVPLVPEPATWALLGVGGVALLWLGRRRTG